MFLKTGYFNQVEKQVAYSQHQFDRSEKECILSIVLGIPGDLSHCSALALEIPGVLKDCCHHDLKVFCETGYNSLLLLLMLQNIKYDSYIKFIIYPSCERALKNRRVKSEKLGSRL